MSSLLMSQAVLLRGEGFSTDGARVRFPSVVRSIRESSITATHAVPCPPTFPAKHSTACIALMYISLTDAFHLMQVQVSSPHELTSTVLTYMLLAPFPFQTDLSVAINMGKLFPTSFTDSKWPRHVHVLQVVHYVPGQQSGQ